MWVGWGPWRTPDRVGFVFGTLLWLTSVFRVSPILFLLPLLTASPGTKKFNNVKHLSRSLVFFSTKPELPQGLPVIYPSRESERVSAIPSLVLDVSLSSNKSHKSHQTDRSKPFFGENFRPERQLTSPAFRFHILHFPTSSDLFMIPVFFFSVLSRHRYQSPNRINVWIALTLWTLSEDDEGKKRIKMNPANSVPFITSSVTQNYVLVRWTLMSYIMFAFIFGKYATNN